MGGGSSFTLAYPAGIASGDLMLIVTSSKQSGDNHPTAPGGWTEQSGDKGFALYTLTASGGESGTLTMGAGENQCGAVLFVVRNAPALIDHDWAWLDSELPVSPSSVATAAGQIHLVGATGKVLGPPSTPSGYSVAAAQSGDTGMGQGYYKVLSASGATGTVTTGTDAGEWSDPYAAWSIIVGAA